MMKLYRFIGAESTIGGQLMNRFGQRFNIEVEVAEDAQRGGCALLTGEMFDSIGFTPEEMKVWADPFISEIEVPGEEEDALAKAVFYMKKQKALTMYHEIQHNLLQPHERVRRDAPASAGAPVSIQEVND